MERVAIENKPHAAKPAPGQVKTCREEMMILHIFAGQSTDVLVRLFNILRKAAITPMDFAFTRERKTVVIKIHLGRNDLPALMQILGKIENLPSVTLVDLLDHLRRSLLSAREQGKWLASEAA